MTDQFVDDAAPAARTETANLKHDPRILPTKTEQLGTIVPTELRAPLPGALREVAAARAQYWPMRR